MHYSLTRATIWNLAGYLYLIIASFISIPILIHSLGVANFGRYSLILASTILVSAINFGLPQAVVRALSKDKEYSLRRQALWATSSQLFLVTGLFAGLVAVVITAWLHVSLTILFLVFAICLLNNLVTHYATLPQAEGHFGYFNSKTLIVGTGNTLLAAYLAYLGQGIVVILCAQLLTYFITLLPLAYFSLKFFPSPRSGKFSPTVARSLIKFGLKNQAGTLIGQIEGQYSKYLLTGIAPIMLSAFLIAQGLVYKLVGGITQIAIALYPRFSSSKNNSDRWLYYRLQCLLFLTALIGCWLYHLFGYSFLSWWLGAAELVHLVDSIMQIFIWYLAILSLTPLSSMILDSRGRPEITSFFAFLTTFIEVVVALSLYRRLGLYAPVYSALIGSIITTPLLLLATHRVLTQPNL